MEKEKYQRDLEEMKKKLCELTTAPSSTLQVN
jgi:hypothetical protein